MSNVLPLSYRPLRSNNTSQPNETKDNFQTKGTKPVWKDNLAANWIQK